MQYTQQQRLAPEVPDESALYSPIGTEFETPKASRGRVMGRDVSMKYFK